MLFEESGVEDTNSPSNVKSSFWAVTFNYVNSIIGSGIIGNSSLTKLKNKKILGSAKLKNIFSGIPFIMKEAGVLVGCMILVLIAFVGDFSLILIVQAGEISEKTTYQVFHIHIRT